MADKNIFRLYTFHKTEVFLDGELIMHHRVVEEVPADHFPLYASIEGDGVVLFFVKDKRINYISEFNGSEPCTVADQPFVFDIVRNGDGSISVKQDDKFLSARTENKQFDLRPKNLDWEHLFLEGVGFDFDEIINTDQNNAKPMLHGRYKISIVLPLTDDNVSIASTVDSIINLKSSEFEVVVVNGLRAELPSSIEQLNNALGDRIIVVNSKTPTNILGSLYNIGIDCANGQYILPINGGDTLAPSALEELYSIADARNADAICLTAVDAPRNEPLDIAKRVHDFVNGKFGYKAHARLLSREFLVVNRIAFPQSIELDEPIFSFRIACLAKNYVLAPNRFINFRAEVEQRTIDKNFFAVINETFETLDKFMRELEFFYRHPTFKFIVFNCFDEYCQRYSDRKNMSPYEFYAATLEEVHNNRAAFNQAAFLSYHLNAANYQYAQLLKRERRIKELKEEIKMLRTETTA